MKKEVVNTIMKYILLAVWVVFLISMFLTCESCEVLKSKRSRSIDSVAFKKNISTDTSSFTGLSVKKNETTRKEDSEWWRQIVMYPRDTTINNFTSPPATIIYEGGRGTVQESSRNSDSNYFNQFRMMLSMQMDSTRAMIQQSEKQKESDTKGLGIITIILIGIGFIILNRVFGFVTSRYTILKRN